MKIARSQQIEPYVPTASMADIAFLLIIFFMVTTVFDVDKTSMTLPQSEMQEDLERGAAVLVVAPSKSAPGEQIYKFSDGQEQSDVITLAELPGLVEASLIRFAEERRHHLFVIKADAETPYRAVDGVIQLLRDNGASNIFLLTATASRS